jgi:nitrogen fixation protein NifX
MELQMALERRLKLVETGLRMQEMGSRVKVAFATGDMRQVDQHFGTADAFAVYSMNAQRAMLAEVVQFGGPLPMGAGMAELPQGSSRDGRAGLQSHAGGHDEDRLASKIEALSGCIAVYCQAIGASAIDRLRAKGIWAVKVSPGAEIKNLIISLQGDLRAGANAWLQGSISRPGRCDAERFDEMEQEGWVE